MSNSAESLLSTGLDPESLEMNEGVTIRSRGPQLFLTSVVVIAKARDELAALTGYKAVDWLSGRESVHDVPIAAAARTDLQRLDDLMLRDGAGEQHDLDAWRFGHDRPHGFEAWKPRHQKGEQQDVRR